MELLAPEGNDSGITGYNVSRVYMAKFFPGDLPFLLPTRSLSEDRDKGDNSRIKIYPVMGVKLSNDVVLGWI